MYTMHVDDGKAVRGRFHWVGTPLANRMSELNAQSKFSKCCTLEKGGFPHL